MRNTIFNQILVGIIFFIIYVPFVWVSYYLLGAWLTLNTTSVLSWLLQFEELNALAIVIVFLFVFKFLVIGCTALVTAIILKILEERGIMK